MWCRRSRTRLDGDIILWLGDITMSKGESAEAAAGDTAKVVEARVGSPAGGRRTLVVGDTDGKEPSPCPVCEARKIAHRLRAAKSRAKKVSK